MAFEKLVKMLTPIPVEELKVQLENMEKYITYHRERAAAERAQAAEYKSKGNEPGWLDALRNALYYEKRILDIEGYKLEHREKIAKKEEARRSRVARAL